MHLIWPSASADPVHAARFVPEDRRQQIEALRADLREGFGFATPGPSAALAPMLASALARVWRCRKHLRATTRWPVTRAQEGAGGSRYELGLGADLRPLPAAELDRLGEEHAAGRPTEDPEVGALMSAMTPRSAAEDPEGRWLLEPCGLRTVHRVDAATEYVSHLPAFGLAITGPDQVEPTGWTAILRGYFALESRQTSLLFYERATGTGAFYVVDGSGGVFLMQEHAGWRTSWTHIVVGDFGGGIANDLLFYERSSGSAEIYATDGAGAIGLLSQFSGWRRTWAQVVTGSFGGPGRSDLLLYDRAAGEIELLAIDAAAGGISLLGRQTGERRSWSLIAALPSGQGTGTELAFYDGAGGLLERRRPDGNGGLPVVGRHRDVGRGWTHMVSGRFGGATGSDLLLYDRTSGRAVVYALADGGGIELVREESGWRRTWTQLVTGQFGGGGAATDVLFYDRATGTGAFYAGSPSGTFRPLRRHADWHRSSAQQFEARYHAAGDPGANVVLVNGIAAADAAWRGPPHNGSPWSSVTRAQAVAAWQAATPRPDDDPALGVLLAAGLPAVGEPGPTVEQLERVPAELVETVRLAPAQAEAILAGHPAAAGGLRDLAGVLRAQRIASVLPLLGGAGDVLLVLGAIGLPGAGVNLQDRRSTGFRWYALPIQGSGAEVSATGSRALFTPADAGVYALVVVGYARTGDTDPLRVPRRAARRVVARRPPVRVPDEPPRPRLPRRRRGEHLLDPWRARRPRRRRIWRAAQSRDLAHLPLLPASAPSRRGGRHAPRRQTWRLIMATGDLTGTTMTAEDIFQKLTTTGVSKYEAQMVVANWILGNAGVLPRTFAYQTPFEGAEAACAPQFTRSFAHQDWVDGEDVVQAEQTTGEDGFNTRFHRIESDLDALGSDVAQAFVCINAMRASLRLLLDELQAELNLVYRQIASTGGGGGFPVPVEPGGGGVFTGGGGVWTTGGVFTGGGPAVTGGTYLGTTKFFDHDVHVFQTSAGRVVLPAVEGVTVTPFENPRVQRAKALGEFLVSPKVQEAFAQGPIPKRAFVERFGDEVLSNGEGCATRWRSSPTTPSASRR